MMRRLFGAMGLIGAMVVGAPGVADAKPRTTRIVGHVSAGSPIKGATMRVYGPTGRRLRVLAKRSVTKTTSDGFFNLVVRGRPSKVRLVATGVKVRHEHVKGTLDLIVLRPGIAKDAYVNPVTTVVAEVHSRHPRRPLSHAESEARRLLHLQPTDSIGRELLTNTPHFNGHAFMAAARKHGGLRSYVDHLVDNNETVSFRATEFPIPESLKKYVPMLKNAKDALSAVYSVGQAAYSFYKWASGEKDTDTLILEAVQKMQKQLDAIQKSLDMLHDQLSDGLIQMKQSIDESTFNSAVAPLQELAGEVEATQGYFQDIIDNRLAPVFSKDLYEAREADIRDNLRDITKKFQGTGNVFRSAILKDGLSNPAYYYAGQNLLSHTQFFMTQSGSLQLARFAEFVLHYQSLAFNLIVQWENSLGAGEHPLPNTTLKNAVQQYLGFTVDEAKGWMDQNATLDTPSIPAKGDLHDEITYLETIKPVPEHTVVQADELGHAQGPMWSTDIGTIELGRNIAARPGQAGYPCAQHLNGSLPLEGKAACEWLARGWADGQDQLKAARDELPAIDWAPATADQTQAFFTRVKTLSKGDRDNILALKTDYWSPPEFTTAASQYYVNSDQPGKGGFCNTNLDAHCSWFALWVDEVTVTTFSSDPAKTFRGTCRMGVDKRKGGTCPVLSVLYRHDTKPAEGERYWPSY